MTWRACAPFSQAPERNSACQHLSDFTSSVSMVMHIPAQPGEKVQLQAMMNMNEARQPPWAWGSSWSSWAALAPHGFCLRQPEMHFSYLAECGSLPGNLSGQGLQGSGRGETSCPGKHTQSICNRVSSKQHADKGCIRSLWPLGPLLLVQSRPGHLQAVMTLSKLSYKTKTEQNNSTRS